MKRRNLKILLISIVIVILVVLGTISWLKSRSVETLLAWKHYNYIKEEGIFYTFYFHPEDKEKIELIRGMNPEAIRLAEKWFGDGDYLEERLRIFLIHKDDEPHPFLNSDGVFYANNIILLRSDSDFLQFTYFHELAHHFLNNFAIEIGLSDIDIPVWFHEGVAESFANRLAPKQLHETINNYEVVPLLEEERPDDWYPSDTYLFMHYAVEYLLYVFNENILYDLILKTNEKGNFIDAFKELTNFDLSTYHLKFLED